MLKKLFIAINLLMCSFSLEAKDAPTILVSIAPYKHFVEKIAGDTVNVNLMVPAGASAHTYEPTPKQMMAAGKAAAWFVIGESFESRVIPSLKAYHPDMAIIDLRQGVDMINADPETGCCCCHANSQDLHIWLSARQVEIQVRTIATALSKLYPENAQRYQNGYELLIQELKALDQEITVLLKPLNSRLILVSHPAYAYFCRDYQLKQMSIEFEGKDPTPQQLTNILNRARQAHVKKVYIQIQYNSKGARLFAKELGAEIVMLDPYSENYFDSMREIARKFAEN
ncbi:MAG TPA: zinc ABC transporter substrate-binding protein [Parachlamydiaceae bacterium]|nr:zinc ABC transporter substrate-binding protein [Parachlamydiaceae bacterium]